MPLYRVGTASWASHLIHQGDRHGYTGASPNISGYSGSLEARRIAQPAEVLIGRTILSNYFPKPWQFVLVIVYLAGVSSGSCAVSGNLVRLLGLTGVIIGIASVVGNVRRIRRILGESIGTAVVSGILTVIGFFIGIIKRFHKAGYWHSR